MGLSRGIAGMNWYLGEFEDIPDISIETVLKAAGMIESMLKGGREPRKEIIENS